MNKTWPVRVLALLVALLPLGARAATEAEKAQQQLAKAGELFTVENFLDAAGGGEVKTVGLFLKAGMDVHSKNESGETALLKAADRDQAEIVRLLLRAGADVNARAGNGETALYKCVKSGYKGGGRVVRGLLLDAKADVRLKYRGGETALHAAASSTNVEAMKALIAAGAEVDARDEQGQTTLYECACTGRTDEMAALIAAGADLNATAPGGGTPLMSASLCGEADVVSLLLSSKADPRLADKDGVTALLSVAQFNMHFVETGRIPEQNLGRIVQELAAAGADPNARRKHDGATPLIEAARQGDLPVVRALLAAGADVNARDQHGKTALQEAKDKPEIVSALKAAGATTAAKPPVKPPAKK